jgi:D-3-phosphoglycerate dehydrogenase
MLLNTSNHLAQKIGGDRLKVLVTDKIAEEALDLLKEKHDVIFSEFSGEELLKEIHKYHALIVRSRTKVTKEVIEAVAELAIGHMISLARHLTYADRSMKEGKWEKKKLKGTELYRKTLGFIGSGRIGGEVAKRAHCFGMKTIAYDPYLPKDIAEKMGIELTSLDTVLKNSDFITIHALLTDETKGMIDEKALDKMKGTAFIINCARGGIIDEKALYKALKEKKIAGAALDVFEQEPPIKSPLLSLENIVFTPHIGASTKEAQIRSGVITAEQVMKVLDRQAPDFIVNKEVLEGKK